MRTSTRRLLVCLGTLLLATPSYPWTASARHYKHAPGWTAPANGPAAESSPLATEEPPAINPEAAPSLTLQPFLESHLNKILAPLGTAAFAQSDLIAYIRDDYAQALSTASDAHKPSYRLAVAVCDAMINSIAERQKAVVALNGAYERRKSESIQPRGGARAVKESDKDEAFFYESQKNNWLQNAAALRQQIATVYRRERAAEAQAGGPWIAPPAAPPETAAAAGSTPPNPTPSVSVPAPETDPVVGTWKWENNAPLTLETGGSIKGSRRGTWQYISTTGAGRNYELHFPQKGWVDTMVLSADGKILDGKGKEGKHVYASR